jgi:hypothetical protein
VTLGAEGRAGKKWTVSIQLQICANRQQDDAGSATASCPRLSLSVRKRKRPDVHAATPRGAPGFHR